MSQCPSRSSCSGAMTYSQSHEAKGAHMPPRKFQHEYCHVIWVQYDKMNFWHQGTATKSPDRKNVSSASPKILSWPQLCFRQSIIDFLIDPPQLPRRNKSRVSIDMLKQKISPRNAFYAFPCRDFDGWSTHQSMRVCSVMNVSQELIKVIGIRANCRYRISNGLLAKIALVS